MVVPICATPLAVPCPIILADAPLESVMVSPITLKASSITTSSPESVPSDCV